MVGDFQTAEDLAQETMLKAFAHLGRLADPERFSTWIYSIARHACLDWLRTRRPSSSVEEMESDGVELADGAARAPADAAETAELAERAVAAIGSLREDYREILLLKHVQNLSYNDIAEITELTVSAVGEKLSRVRQMLRRKLRLSPR
jgi:RNA polymerase sigma-70 factor (ECF subfamily)